MSLWRGGKGRKSFKKTDISKPTKFEHKIHADFDPITGDIRGLPVQWQAFLSPDFMCRHRPQPLVDSNCVTFHKPIVRGNTFNNYALGNGKAAYLPLSYLTKPSYLNNGVVNRNSPFHVETYLNKPSNVNWPTTSSSIPNSNALLQRAGNSGVVLQTTANQTANEQFRNAFLSVVNPIDPRNELSKFIKIECGSTSTVFASYLIKNRQKVAVKCMKIWRQQRRELLFNEVLVMRGIKHPNLVELLSSHLVGDELWVIMEFMEKGSLTNLITHKRLNEKMIATVSRQCLNGLAFLHSHGIIHRDIKSDSILIAGNGVVKISDFGFCGQLSESCPQRHSLLGTPYWFSVQVAAREAYGTDTDIWSFGITVIEMIFGEPPYFDYPTATAIQKIIELPPPQLPPSANASIELESFLSQMLVKEIFLRSTAIQLLQHPFLRNAQPPVALLPLLLEVEKKQHLSMTNRNTQLPSDSMP